MVRDASTDPVATGLEDLAPGFVTRRISPALVAERLVDGIERRAPRVVVPRWYALYSALRGILNPLMEAGMVSDRRVCELIERAERIEAEAARSRPAVER
jgi:hypothetical protein